MKPKLPEGRRFQPLLERIRLRATNLVAAVASAVHSYVKESVGFESREVSTSPEAQA